MDTHIDDIRDYSIEDLSLVLKALSDTNRLNIVISIGKKVRSVSEIVKATGLTQTLVSFHLRALREADVVRTERNGPFIHYSLSDPFLLEVISQLSQIINGKKLPIGKTGATVAGKSLRKKRR